MRSALIVALAVMAGALSPVDGLAQAPARGAAGGKFFRTTLTPTQMAGQQAVVETSAGSFIIQLLPEAAPNHVGYFMKRVAEGGYDGTTFHRAIPMGIIQGGDPLSRDQAQRARYGTGGLGVLRAEFNQEPMTAGAVAAVLQPGKADSAGAQFFVLVSDQPYGEGEGRSKKQAEQAAAWVAWSRLREEGGDDAGTA